MKGQIKNALMTTAIVLGTIFVLRQVSVTKTWVDRAIQG